MKKKRNFLSIISSLFGVAAVCGLSLFSLLDQKKESQIVDAVSINTLSSETGSSTIRVTSDTNKTFYLNYSYSISYNRYYDGTLTYGFNVMLNYYLSFISNNTNYYVRPRQDNTSTFAIVFESSRTNQSITAGNSVKLLFNKFYDYYETWLFFNRSYIWFDLTVADSSVGSYTSETLNDSFVVDSTGSQIIYDLSSLNSFNRNSNMVSYTLSYVLDDYDTGFTDGYNSGFNDGYSSGTSSGYNSGYSQGYDDGVLSQQDLLDNYYQSGYSDGYDEGQSVDSTVVTIFSGILQVAMVPVNFFLAIFNFEILGINLSAFIRAIFTVVLTIIVLKTVLGKGGGGSDN